MPLVLFQKNGFVMSINFFVIGKNEINLASQDAIILVPDGWDDFDYKTSFDVYCTINNQKINLGTTKIGYNGQLPGRTLTKIPNNFTTLSEDWFSLGQDVDFYKNIKKHLGHKKGTELLTALRDASISNLYFDKAKDEMVFRKSLMRDVSTSSIFGQFSRIIQGKPELTSFSFSYSEPKDPSHAGVNLYFQVEPASKPPTNVHVLIGANGVGKTTILNNMVGAITEKHNNLAPPGTFHSTNLWGIKFPLPSDYFSSVISVSFSAFDPFIPPSDQPDRTQGIAYFYIGMKQARQGGNFAPPKTSSDFEKELFESIGSCFSQPAKRERWFTAIKQLESDSNFGDMDLSKDRKLPAEEGLIVAKQKIRGMSSGHFIVLLTISKLVDKVEEKTLVLLDEPESHLHPPLLSAFTRALSDLLYERNGVAIIATHSPVVAQEVPRSCVWKLTRIRAEGRSDRPDIETFGENVGVLTREIFGLEVSKSGFHSVLQDLVNRGGTFDQILDEYDEQLGFEAQAILRTLVRVRDKYQAKPQ